MTERLVVDPITRIEGICASRRRWMAMPSSRPTHRAPWCAASRSSCAVATRAMPGPSRSASAACAPSCTHGVDPLGRRRLKYEIPRERAADPQPDDRRAIHPRPRHALLPPARAGLGGRGVGAVGRPERDLDPGTVPRQLAEVLARLLRRHEAEGEGLSSRRDSSASSPRPTGATRRTSCRRRRTSMAVAPLPRGPGLAA